MKFSIKDFFSKCDQIRRKLRIWSHLLKNSSMENFIFCAVYSTEYKTITRTFSRSLYELSMYPYFWSIPYLGACNFIKERLLHSCFPVNIFKNLFFIEHLR